MTPRAYDPAVKAFQESLKGQLNPGSDADQIDPYLGDKNDQRKRSILTQDENELDPEMSSGADVSAMMIPASLKQPADEWVPVDKAQPKDEWVAVGDKAPAAAAAPDEPVNLVAAFGGDDMAPIAKAFAAPWKEPPADFSPETVKTLSDMGLFAPGDKDHYSNPLHAMTELIAQTALGVVNIFSRSAQSAMGVMAATGEYINQPMIRTGIKVPVIGELTIGSSAQLGQTLAAATEYRFTQLHDSSGIPHNVYAATKPKLTPPIEGTVSFDIKPMEGSPNPTLNRSVAGLTGDPLVDAFLNHPVIKEVADNPVVDKSHTVPNSWGGSNPSDNPTLYLDKDFPKTITAKRLSDPTKTVTFDPAEGASVHENVEEFVIDRLVEGGMDRDTALKVAFHEFGEKVEDALYAAHDIDPADAEKQIQPHLDRIAAKRADNIPPDLFTGTYPDGDPAKAGPGPIDKPTPEEVARGREILEAHIRNNPEQYSPKTIDVDEARSLGVVGDERTPLDTGTPEEAGKRAMAADASQEKITGETPEAPNAHRQRFAKFTGKLLTEQDVKNHLLQAYDENEGFPAARAGDIPLYQKDLVAQAAGVHPAELDTGVLSRTLHNDNMVRNAIQMMLDVAEQMQDAAREHNANPTPESRIKFQEAILRRDLAVEQVVGLRAEWGRTGNAIQEFQAKVKDQESLSDWMKERRAKGEAGKKAEGFGARTPTELDDLAKAVESMPKTRANKLVNDLRAPNAFDKFMWYYVNNLISGWATHTKYVIANTIYGAVEIGTTAVAGGVGAGFRALGREGGVRSEEALGQLYGYATGVPQAFKAGLEAFRTGLQTPLPGEGILGIIPKRNKNTFFQQVAPKNAVAQVFGIPMKSAALIHTVFNHLGYRASIEAQAVRIAREEASANPSIDWQARRADLAEFPTKEMMQEAINDGYRLTFINDLGPAAKSFNDALNKSKVGRLVLPFTHIPLNVAARGLEYHPVFGLLRQEVRDDIAGKNGAVKQDKAIARLAVGTAAGVYISSLYASDVITGNGPVDPTDRDVWLRTHAPYSVKLPNGEWISYNRFGPVGVMLGLHANLADAIPYMKQGDAAKAAALVVHNTGKQLQDELGMQGIKNLQDIIDDPEHKGLRALTGTVGGMVVPWSSFMRQTASAMDPEMRDTKTFIEGLKYHIPGMRQSLQPQLDAFGRPKPNPGYGGDLPVPGLSAVMQHKAPTTDPVDRELADLGIKPAPIQNKVGGITLPPEVYSEYAQKAGSIIHASLEMLINDPTWKDKPIGIRQDIIRETIKDLHKSSATLLQASMPALIQLGIKNKQDHIEGIKPTKLLPAAGVGAGPPDNLLTDIAKGISGMLPREPPPVVAPNAGGGTRG